jgi:hypothetical protein
VLLGIASRHPERIPQAREKSKDPAELSFGFATGSLDSARDHGVAQGRDIFRHNPYNIDGRSLFYAPSIGTDPGFADIIIEQASAKS